VISGFTVGRHPEWAELVLEQTKDQKQESVEFRGGPLQPLVDLMIGSVPDEGLSLVRSLTVVFRPHKGIAGHAHNEMTVLYYADPAQTPILIGKEAVEFLPEVGDILVLERDVLHSVPKNLSGRRRVSVACLVEKFH